MVPPLSTALKLALSAVLLAATPIAAQDSPVTRVWEGKEYACKCYPGDECWPQQNAWGSLNDTVDGNLHVHIPPEAACHNTFEGPLGTVETYDAQECQHVMQNYADEEWSTGQQALLLWKYFTNHTCTPTNNPNEPCTLGYYGVYVIEAQTTDHIKASIDFARENNLRLVIRNTGHDFIGRSTGWGALIINTFGFKDVQFIDAWTGAGDYDGGAVRVGAGIQGRDLLRQAFAHNVAVVTGECPTVGIAGGLVGGGGHGPLTTLHGMVADNALEFDAITAEGEFVTANADENADLFYALKGGGPSTYAVVTSATFRTYPEEMASGGELYINATVPGTTEDQVWEGVRIFHSYANHLVDHGLYVYYEVAPFTLRIRPYVAIGKTREELDAIVAPILADLTAAGVPFTATSKQFASFFELYMDLFEDEGAGAFALTGGWAFTHDDVAARNDDIVDAFKLVVSPREDLAYTGVVIGHLFNPGYGWPSAADSATHPKWRNSTDFVISIVPVPVDASLEKKAELQDLLTNTVDAALREAGPEGFTYINEADPYQPNWQEAFWGDVYERLVCIRRKWDPNGVFYSIATPGTEDWEVIEYGTRLCKAV
ncbi:isoamyl alcohol oxidase [Sodiomyces alkalinus F11]|uniref:Isoamyl alcohol oxidase n=1 Tax=Sodiomyces alkalinus (strain CBS 110278 / VKM F-3762 / F11) TaxID=1314773 RepID=A0A3N2QA92_SODAK|nr:isoamyl alcohol oxidase [Sodiomyces alkalinus F11]ROT43662.1 isoamyl alcohol oxidase [Sodiomyces alkalinus F11]